MITSPVSYSSRARQQQSIPEVLIGFSSLAEPDAIVII
jgi:hypothetical protein